MILHITNDFSGSTVYKNLIMELDNLGISQIIYTPIRDVNKVGKNSIELKNNTSKIIYSTILSKYLDRIFYQKKIHKIVKDIESKVDLSKITFIHAHTWYSDGGVAYLLHKKYNIPYMVAVRSTDIQIFYKYFLFERGFGKQILRNANRIAVISKAYYLKLNQLEGLNHIRTNIQSKLEIIPNGVDSFWINNAKEKELLKTDTISILYIGNIIQRKHLFELQKAVINLKNEFKNQKIHLNIVGDANNKYADQVKKIVEEHKDTMTHHGWITDKQELLEIIRKNHIFAMASVKETFGLVYIEALLQGLPVLYTKNEGIDGFYDENIGEKVTKPTTEEIEEKLSILIKNYQQYKLPKDKLVTNHNWSIIAETYKEIYNN